MQLLKMQESARKCKIVLALSARKCKMQIIEGGTGSPERLKLALNIRR